jgi:hypothetical protein
MEGLEEIAEAAMEVAASETVIQEAITDRVENDNETAIELARIHSEAQTEQTQIQADAAVDIAAQQFEVDDQWLSERLDGLAVGHESILLELASLRAEVMESISTLAAALLKPSPSTQTPSLEIAEPATLESPAVTLPSVSEAVRQGQRVRRLI